MNKNILFSFACIVTVSSYASEITPKKIGIFFDINQRKYQGDFFYHGSVEDGYFYAVYDGHCSHQITYEQEERDGSFVAKFLAEKFPIYFSKTSGHIKDRMIATCKHIDNDPFIKEEHKECGSTAAIVFIKDNTAHCMHVGDSRILIEKNTTIDFASRDHMPNRLDEYFRIEDAGGIVFNQRVNGFLAISRTFGDYVLDSDKKIIIVEPDYEEIELTNEHKFLLLATNGLWNTVSNEEAVCLLNAKRTVSDMNLLAKMLAMLAKT